MELLVCIICSVVTSAITTKILATHYFHIVDGYVKDIVDKTKDFVESIKRKL